MTKLPIIHFSCRGASKKFTKSNLLKYVYGATDVVKRNRIIKSAPSLRRAEFWGIQDLSLAIRNGESVGVIGPKGSGKSTLIKLLSGELTPGFGEVRLSEDVKACDWNVSSLKNGCLNTNTQDEFFSALGKSLISGKQSVPCLEGFGSLLKNIANEEFGAEFDYEQLQPRDISWIIHKFFLQTFPGLLLLDDFMSGLSNADQHTLARSWRGQKHGVKAHVLVFQETSHVESVCDRLIVVQDHRVVHDGDVKDGLELYDQLFRIRPDQAKKHLPEVRTVHCPPSGDSIEIRTAGFLIDKKSVTNAREGDALTFYCDFKVDKKLGSFSIALSLLKVGSDKVYVLNDKDKSTVGSVMLTKGRYRFIVQIDAADLPDGLLSPLISISGVEQITTHLNSAAIRVRNDSLLSAEKAVINTVNSMIYPGFTYESNTNYFNELAPNTLCIDCGANVGDVTQLMLMQGCRVIAFEPNSVAFHELSERFEGIADVQCIPKGVYETHSHLQLFSPDQKDIDPLKSSVSSSIYADKKNVSTATSEIVELVDIAGVIEAQSDPIALIKIDIEGAEYRVLKRIIETDNAQKIGRILVEEHYLKIPSLEKERREVIELIEARGIKHISLDWM